MASVTISDVKKSFGNVPIIHGVTIDIPDGEFVVLVGPSGCGKSTLLRMIAGLEKITGGTISIGDRIVNNLPPKDRDISMVFQNYALYPHMTVAENMAFSLMIAGTPEEEKKSRVREAAEILGLVPLLERLPRQLSGGQRQRVAMGRSIVRKPQVFLFDEPLSNLDAKLRVAMRAEIKSLHKRLRTTTVYVTHDQVEAMTMADSIVVMRAGHVEQMGRPLDLYDYPRNRFVAQFIGSPAMNMVEAEVKGGRLVPVGGGAAIDVPAPAGLADGRKILVGKRPEHVLLSESGIPAKVKVIEPTGSETYVLAELAGQEFVAVFRDRVFIRDNDTIAVSFAGGRTYFFDKDSELCIEA